MNKDARAHSSPAAVLRKMLQPSVRVLFEMLVIFVSVLAAFWVESYRENAEIKQRAERILEAFQFDMRTQADWFLPWSEIQNARRAEWKSRRAQGEQIAPFYIRVMGNTGYPMTTWQAAVASDALRVIDPPLVRQIGNFYWEGAGIGAMWERYLEQTESSVFPLEYGNPAEFFDPDSGDYRALFRANQRILDEVWFESLDKWYAWPIWMIGEIQDEIDRTNNRNSDSLFCAVSFARTETGLGVTTGTQYDEIDEPVDWIMEFDGNALDDSDYGGLCWIVAPSLKKKCRLAAYYENLALKSDELAYQNRTSQELRRQRNGYGCGQIFGSDT